MKFNFEFVDLSFEINNFLIENVGLKWTHFRTYTVTQRSCVYLYILFGFFNNRLLSCDLSLRLNRWKCNIKRLSNCSLHSVLPLKLQVGDGLIGIFKSPLKVINGPQQPLKLSFLLNLNVLNGIGIILLESD